METESPGILSRQLADRDLLRLLCRGADRLPRAVVDEAIRRGERLVAPLADACRSEEAWRQRGPLFWTAIHSTFILGAMRRPEALDALLAALRWSTRYDVDWAYEALPAIFGALGRPARRALEGVLLDRDAGLRERAMAVHSLAGVAAHHPVEQGEVLDFLRGVLGNTDEAVTVRQAAAQVLLSFARPGDRPLVEASGFFESARIESAYSAGSPRLEEYLVDWLDFYREEAIETRVRIRTRQDEDARWARGARGSEPWVDEELAQLLRKYEWMLVDLEDGARGEALWVADSMMEYIVDHEGRAPWRWDDSTTFSYLMDCFARRVSMDHPGNVAAVPDNVLRFVQFCRAEGLLSQDEQAQVEALISQERDGFLQAALDPELRRRAKSVLEALLAEGIDPADAREVETKVLQRPPDAA